MKSLRIFNRRAGSVFAAAALVLATTVPAMVSAATVTSRSIAMSSSVKDTASVNYTVKFKGESATSIGAFVVDFCTTAAVGTACVVPDGFSTNGIGTTGDDTVAAINSNGGVKVTLDTPVTTGNEVNVVLTGIHNPEDAGVFYARIVSYEDGTTNYHYTSPTSLGTHLDDGGVALYATDGFGVNGRVAETMVFCAGGSTSVITSGCTGTITAPNISLGTNGVLDSTAVSTGVVKTQISTNAVGGAVVYLKSDAAGCGGLLREGSGTAAQRCGIAPKATTPGAITAGQSLFGLKLGNLGGASSTTTAVEPSSYDTSNYFMNWVSGDASGVTGPYGDAIYNTSSAPVSDGTADLTFGASISALTPAGNYKAQFNLIATGTF